MKKTLRVLSYLAAALVGSAITLAIVPLLIQPTVPASYSKLDQLADYMDTVFVEDVDRTELEDAAAAAMIEASGDRWSYYIPADQYQAHVEQNENAYVGIGITIQKNDELKGFEIVEVTEGGPAAVAGLKKHDVLVKVDGQNCFELGMDETRNLVKGEEGTEVSISVMRDGKELPFTVKRMRVEVPVAVYEMLSSGYGYIQIKNFDSKCADETIAAVETLTKQGAKGIIFDVRFNPGGYQHELVKLLDYILPEGPLFKSESYTGEITVDQSDEKHIEIPMAVLVNGDSYSAAEFFAAALQEYDYAEIVGQQTCGKGHYQVTYRLNDGSAAAISTGRYYTPNDVNLEGVGIVPDVVVDVDEETAGKIYFGDIAKDEDPQIQGAISALEK